MFSKTADAVLAALGDSIPRVAGVERERIREVAAREAGEIGASEMNVLGDALDHASAETSLVSLALVELIEALAYRTYGQESQASDRLFRASFLVRYGRRLSEST